MKYTDEQIARFVENTATLEWAPAPTSHAKAIIKQLLEENRQYKEDLLYRIEERLADAATVYKETRDRGAYGRAQALLELKKYIEGEK